MNRHILEVFNYKFVGDNSVIFYLPIDDLAYRESVARNLLYGMGLNHNMVLSYVEREDILEPHPERAVAIQGILKTMFSGYELKRGGVLDIPVEVIQHFKHNAAKFYFTDNQLWTRYGVIQFPIKGHGGTDVYLSKNGVGDVSLMPIRAYMEHVPTTYDAALRTVLNHIRRHVSHQGTVDNAKMVCRPIVDEEIAGEGEVNNIEHPMFTGKAMEEVIALAISSEDHRLLKAIGMPLEVAQAFHDKRKAGYLYRQQLWTRRGMVPANVGNLAISMVEGKFVTIANNSSSILENRKSSMQLIGQTMLAKGRDLTQKERAYIREVMYIA